MRTPSARLVAFAAVLGLAACSSSDTAKTTVPPALAMTASLTAIRPNGTATTTIHVSGSTSPPITVTASNGTFANGMKSDTIGAPAGDVILTACDGKTDAKCTGSIAVSAIDAAFAVGKLTVNLIPKETICNDGIDNNGDGLIDCADPDCNLQVCAGPTGAAGTCQSSVCVVPTCTPSPEICTDGIDNDCNGKIDCADTVPCDGKPCKTGSPTFFCKSGVCTDVSSGLGISVAPTRTRLPADGVATTSVKVTLLANAAPQANTAVTLSATLGQVVAPTTIATDSNGEALFTFKSDAGGGIATVTASVTAIPAVSATAQIAMPVLGEILLSSLTTQVMGVKFSGVREQNAIQVLLLDTDQKPYPDGLAVRFEHQQLGGSEISKPWTADTATCLAANKCIGFLGQTDSPSGTPDHDGLAQVNLYSGTAAGLVSILTSATAGGVTRSFTIQNIAIVGAKASGAHVSVDCSPKNVPAFTNSDCVNSFYAGGDITCTAYFADRFNNVLGVPLLATFDSEAGSAGPPVTTAAYDPTVGGDQSKTIGFAKNTVKIAGYPLPRDVAPSGSGGSPAIPTVLGAEPSFPDVGCSPVGPTVFNPRDGLSTIIVMARGEEGFVDRNGNGVYDTGEPFIDMGEPFLDMNDNGKYDVGEPFWDTNGNGVYDGPNGKWDADTVIWAETRVLYTGAPFVFYTGTPAIPTAPYSRWLDPWPDSPPGTFSVGSKSVALMNFVFADRRLNPLAASSTYALSSLAGRVTVAMVFPPTNVDNLGMEYFQQYCDTAPDPTTGAWTPTTCTATCTTAPCYRVTIVGGFPPLSSPTGVEGTASFTASQTGKDTVNVSATVAGVTYPPVPISGSVSP